MTPTVAPKHTYGTLDANVIVENSASVRIFNISIYNGTGASTKFQLQYADGSGVYADVGVASGQTYIYEVKFLANQGLRIASVSDADATVSIFHSGGGS